MVMLLLVGDSGSGGRWLMMVGMACVVSVLQVLKNGSRGGVRGFIMVMVTGDGGRCAHNKLVR